MKCFPSVLVPFYFNCCHTSLLQQLVHKERSARLNNRNLRKGGTFRNFLCCVLFHTFSVVPCTRPNSRICILFSRHLHYLTVGSGVLGWAELWLYGEYYLV